MAVSKIKKVQFAGTYLNRSWTRQFILGSLLQRFRPSLAPIQTHHPSPSPSPPVSTDVAVLQVQQAASERWGLAMKPLDAISEARILGLLARYACGEGFLSEESLEELRWVTAALPGAPPDVQDPRQMHLLLEQLGYVEPRDNLRRVAFSGSLHYPPQALSLIGPYLTEEKQRDGGDPFDAVREVEDGPGYAIDSASTSEVDDAIGVEVDPVTGEERFTVYVSDATVYCPFDSPLEQLTARSLATTTYLPEGVFFMLPKAIVEAATLREDRPCRTFCIQFHIHPTTGELYKYRVYVGWLKTLRRITYDQVQALIEGKQNGVGGGGMAQPEWLRPRDRQLLLRLHEVAQLRFAARMRRGEAKGKAAIDSNLPDPLIKVENKQVVSLMDQIISTQDARLTVAELMIAANEVCSRVAQAHQLSIPYRGTRSLSSDHEVAHLYQEPQGVTTVASLDRSHSFIAECMVRTIRRLSAVTRAVYYHQPIHHAGLDTTHYTHSTSPLRRYADMLVHHQLKVLVWEQHRKKGGALRASPSSFFTQQLIPEPSMAALCLSISNKQMRSSLLQDNSNRYWTLRYMENLIKGSPHRHFLCLVGETRRVDGAPAYRTSSVHAQATLEAVSGIPLSDSPDIGRGYRPSSAASPSLPYVSDVYLPEVQLAHTVYHREPLLRVGAVAECVVVDLLPTQGLLELKVVGVREGVDERQSERLWRGGAVASLDA